MSASRRMQIDPYLSPCTKFKSKWIEGLNIKLDMLNPIQEKIENCLEHLGTGDKFLNRTPIVQTLRSIINKWDLIKMKGTAS